MKVVRRAVLFTLGVFALTLSSDAPQAQSGASITPDNAAILVGQTQQFTANGLSTPGAIAGGGYHTCMLMSDRSVRCFGENNWGQLGNNSFSNSSTPVIVSGLTTAVAVDNGIEHSCALAADGTVRCWGTNFVGQLGDGTFGGLSAVPKTVQNLSGVTSFVAGGFHNCAVLSDSTVKCWGRNQDGQVGNGNNTTDVSPPSAPVSGLGAVAAITAGGYHTCALMPDSTVRCWGRNARGQLGDGTTNQSSTPVTVSGLTTATQLTGGLYHSCALLRDGTVQCWGENANGQLGNTLPFSSVPTTVGGITNAVGVSAGVFHTCALLSDGTARCWGQNTNGELGNGTTTDSSSPVVVSGLNGAISVVGAGLHTCALMSNRSVRCWGWNVYGQLGNGNTTDSSTPVSVVGTGVTWTSSTPAVATIDAGGLATGVARGTTTISATDSSGTSAITSLTVRDLFALSVSRQGAGTGTVTSAPAGINCGSTCSATFVSDSQVTLTAAADSGSIFTGWTGCDSVSGTTCTVTMSGARSVSAGFDLQSVTLTVGKTGAGTGTVTSSPAGIACGADCSEPYASGTTVTLTATPDATSVFTGWTGCDATSGATCSVTMSAARSVTAAFDLQRFTLTVGKTGAGTGTVTSSPAGIACGADCSEPYTSGTTVTLTATPDASSVFTGWTGCDATSGTSCSVTMSAARSVTAAFDPQRFTLTVGKTGAGTGTVTSSPAGIACGADCSEPYNSGTPVTLTAAAGAGSLFIGWTGCDAVSGTTCSVTMNAAKSVTAAFDVQRFTLTVGKSGAGDGTVTSSPAGIACGADCSEPYNSGTTVTLTAAAASGSLFAGWTGCDAVSGATCTIAMSGAKTVTATFNLQFFTLGVSKTGRGSGTVTSSPAGINCGSTCAASFSSTTVVTLTASPNLLSAFTGWTGCDAVSGNTCTVRMSAARSVTAGFRILGLL